MNLMRRISSLFFVCSLVFCPLFGGIALAQGDVTPIPAERPGFTSGTDTVTPGRIQLEAGLSVHRSGSDQQSSFGDSAQLRFPLRDNLEARLGLPSYLRQTGSADAKGLGDASVSLKYRFLETNPKQKFLPALAFIGGVELPTGTRDLREDDYQPSLALEAGWDLGERFSLGGNVTYAGIRQGGARYDEWGTGLCLNINISPLWQSFGEVYRVSDTGVGEIHQNFFDTGASYRVAANTMLDISGGVGILGTRDSWFVGGGISRRW